MRGDLRGFPCEEVVVGVASPLRHDFGVRPVFEHGDYAPVGFCRASAYIHGHHIGRSGFGLSPHQKVSGRVGSEAQSAQRLHSGERSRSRRYLAGAASGRSAGAQPLYRFRGEHRGSCAGECLLGGGGVFGHEGGVVGHLGAFGVVPLYPFQCQAVAVPEVALIVIHAFPQGLCIGHRLPVDSYLVPGHEYRLLVARPPH